MAQGSFLAHKMTGAVVDPLLLRVRAEIMTFLLTTLSKSRLKQGRGFFRLLSI